MICNFGAKISLFQELFGVLLNSVRFYLRKQFVSLIAPESKAKIAVQFEGIFVFFACQDKCWSKVQDYAGAYSFGGVHNKHKPKIAAQFAGIFVFFRLSTWMLTALKTKNPALACWVFACDLVRIQTWNLLSRNQVRYSVAPQGRFWVQRYTIFNKRWVFSEKNDVKKINQDVKALFFVYFTELIFRTKPLLVCFVLKENTWKKWPIS